MPFHSKAQQGFMYATKPGIAAGMEDATDAAGINMKTLPEHSKGKKPAKKEDTMATTNTPTTAFANIFKDCKTPGKKSTKVAKAMSIGQPVKKFEKVAQVGSVAEAMGLTRCN